MGEHERLEPQYKQPRYPIESPTPVYGLEDLNVEEIEARIDEKYGAVYYSDEEFDEDGPEQRAANQMQWELGLLAEDHPELGLEIIEAIKDERSLQELVTKMIARLFGSDPEAAMALTQEFLDREVRRSTGDMSAALANVIEDEVIINPKTLATLVGTLAFNYGQANKRAAQAEADAEQLRAANRKLGQRAGQSTVILNSTGIQTGGGNTKSINFRRDDD